MPRISTAILRDKIAEDETVRELFQRRVVQHPDKPLLRWAGRDLSYGEIDQQSNAVANTLIELGVAAGDRIAMMMVNSPEWIAFWLGAAKVGAVTVTLNTAQKGTGLAYQLEDAGPSAIAIDSELLPRLLELDDYELPRLIVRGDSDPSLAPRAISFDQVLAGCEAPPSAVSLSRASPCSILYTSGTTGPSKGCLLPHGQYLAGAHLHASQCGYDGDTVAYSCLPLFHTNAQNYSLLSVIACGGTLALDGRFSASGFWQRLIDTGATTFTFVGSMAQSLWNQEPSAVEAAHGARVAFGVPVPLSIWAEWEARFNCSVIYAYGMTENGLPTIFHVDDTPIAPAVRGSAGQASPMAEVAIVDDGDAPVAAGEVGEIVTRPKIPYTMMIEYLNRPGATIAAFRNCWFHTGDMGYLDEHGHLYFVDRKKDAVRRRGEMVSSWEVETTVSSFPGMVECAVIGVPSELGEDEILVVAVVENETTFDAAALLDFCRDRTAAFQVPRYVRVVPSLPRTATQRVEKYRLREEGVTADTYDAGPSRAPRA